MKLSSFLTFAAFGVKTILLKGKRPILGTIIVTDKCNLSCKHCSVNNLTGVIHPYAQIKREMEALYKMGCASCSSAAGKPFCGGMGSEASGNLLWKRNVWAS